MEQCTDGRWIEATEETLEKFQLAENYYDVLEEIFYNYNDLLQELTKKNSRLQIYSIITTIVSIILAACYFYLRFITLGI